MKITQTTSTFHADLTHAQHKKETIMKITILLLLGLSLTQWIFPARTDALPLSDPDECRTFRGKNAINVSFFNPTKNDIISRRDPGSCSILSGGGGRIKLYLY
ncbi:hypothetical protein [Pseudomonas marginalis]|uniref:hypothetical protein n=1 Tax=Pseudomonas marginalis TaxID=298 RepID=UPI002034649D|nr:hypothetical protein [Pseudomonas marginalis]MCM2378682.1 hypothetical protein [Pseudomonas marginalis]